MIQETEIKIPLAALGMTLHEARARIEQIGFTVHKTRVFERNLVFDRADASLKSTRQLLRLRDAGGIATLTYKGLPDPAAKHKSREERETSVGDYDEMRVILERLGYHVRFIYEKHRTEFTETGTAGTITLDETPAGNFLELEGEPGWIDATARRLGASESHYSTASYSQIYADWCAEKGITPTNMQFAP